MAHRASDADMSGKVSTGNRLMPHVLIVDDDPAVRDVMQMGLELDGACRVTGVESAEAALSVIAGDRPDAAVIDAVLPCAPGLALARTVINLDIPVLIVSGEPQLQSLLIDGGCRFLLKPFRIRELVVETRVLLDNASRRRIDLGQSLDRLLTARRELAHVIDETQRLVEESRRLRAELPASYMQKKPAN